MAEEEEEFTDWDHEKEVFKYLRRVMKKCKETTFQQGLELLLEFCRQMKPRELPIGLQDRLFGHTRAISTLFLRGVGYAEQAVYKKFYEDLIAVDFPWSKKQRKNLREVLEKVSEPPKRLATPPLPESLMRAEPAKRLQRAEAVLAARSSRIALVLDKTYNLHNQMAMLRTADLFGVQNVYVVLPLETTNIAYSHKVTRGAERWLTKRVFETSEECIEALRKDGREIWVADVVPTAEEITPELMAGPFPDKMAIVLGREATGPSKEMTEAADRVVFLPQHGFCDSFNVSVATALLLQSLFLWCPEARGAMGEEERSELRTKWYELLATNEQQKVDYQARLEQPPKPLDDLRRQPNPQEHTVPKRIQARNKWREETNTRNESALADEKV